MKAETKKVVNVVFGLTAVACCALGMAFQGANDTLKASAEGMSVNMLGYLEWAEVDGATSYKVSSVYGDFTVTENKANVGDAITKAAEAAEEEATSASVAFTVTPYTGETAGAEMSYTYEFSSYIDYGFNTVDLSEAQKNADGSLVGDGALSKMNGTMGAIGAMYKNNLFSFGFHSNAQLSTKIAQNSYFYLFGKDSVVSHSGGTYYYNTSTSEYAWAIRFARSKFEIYLEGTHKSAKVAHTEATKSYTVVGELAVPSQTEAIESYAYTVGVFDTYDLSGAKTGETLYILREVLDEENKVKTFNYQGSVFVDNQTLADNNITDEDYEGCTGFGARSPSDNYTYELTSGEVAENESEPLCEVSKLSFSGDETKTFHWYFNNLNDLAKANIANVKARITFKGQTTEHTLAETNAESTYKLSYEVANEDYEEEILISVVIPGGAMTETLSYTAQKCMEDIISDVDAEYDITYVLADGVTNSSANPAVYKTASVTAFVAPESIPAGYLFKGWYKNTDTEFVNKVTNTAGLVGEITLVAVIAQGYVVTLDINGETQTYEYFVGSEALALTAPEVSGKSFVKWQIQTAAGYEDYAGTSIVPTADTTLRAVYEDNTYQITYVAEGATHTNPATYTAGTKLTFTAAKKEGYFFGGWYKDAAFLQKVTDTEGFMGDITLYAWFIKSTIGATATVTASVTRQLVPMPLLPEGFTCSTKLFIKGTTTALELESGLYYVFADAGKVYTAEYTIMLPTGEIEVKTTELTVVADASNDTSDTQNSGGGNQNTQSGNSGDEASGCGASLASVSLTAIGCCALALFKNKKKRQ